ncbi:glutaredoxin [Thermococcus pacificus]|uniref:Glutaredoxin n=1 Tax=Thermococcus pacificus TaxID=71998 RepID=A0A218P828_9EURY|nr:glutaredoxin [Thermococcus pacificus]ASJ06928.1 glutaredoxin [Thermococcus pacificus]
MKKLGMVLLLMLLIGFAAGCISNSNTSTQSQTTSTGPEYVVINGTKIYLNQIHFYMYGLKTCPHCRAMKEEIPKVYGNDSLTYYELMNNETNMKLFETQYTYTGISGVPAIAIAYGGNLTAIIEGEYNVSATPKIIYTSMENRAVVLFVGGKAYLLKNQTIISTLKAIYIEHRLPENETG